MADLVSKMTATQFVMRLVISETTSIDVTVNGTGLKYDPLSGMILSGEVGSISLSNYYGTGKKQSLIDTTQINNLDLDAAKLVEVAGDKFWNEAKRVVEIFDKLKGLTGDSTTSFFSKDKTDAHGSEADNAIVGSKFNDAIYGESGDDDLFGGAGVDRLFGGTGDDALTGDAGDDFVFDTEGNNQFYGGAGNDILRGGAGVDQLDGGKDRDILYGGGGYDWARGGDGIDQFVFSIKEAGKLTVLDFTDADVLVNAVMGNREEGFRDFLDHARQSGRNVVYDNGEMTVVLKAFKLADLGIENFGDGAKLPELWPGLL